MKTKYALSVACASFLMATQLLLAQETMEGSLTNVLAAIRSSSPEKRHAAKEKIVDIRRQVIRQMMAILSAPVGEGERWSATENSARNLAMEILGAFRSEAAVPHLIKWLRPPKGQSYWVQRPVRYSPAAKALIKIGKPATAPLVALIAAEADMYPMGSRISMLLAEIEGKRGAKFVLEQALAGQEEAEGKKRIEEALAFLEDYAKKRP